MMAFLKSYSVSIQDSDWGGSKAPWKDQRNSTSGDAAPDDIY
jgi:hypothetical protein